MNYLANKRWWVRMVLVVVGAMVITIVAFALAWVQNHRTTADPYESATILIGGQVVQARVPLTQKASELGLGGVTRLSDTEGMLWYFRPATSAAFWMKGMKIGLDFIWIRDGRVTQITADVLPPTNNNLPIFQPNEAVNNVLEVRAGFARDHQIVVGTAVELPDSE